MPDLTDGKLRIMNENDLKMVLKWRNSDRIRNSMFSNHIISWEEHQKWYQSLNNKDNVYLIFEFCNRAVGLVNFTEFNKSIQTCFWGFYLGETEVPKGTGLLMGYWGLEYAFNNLKIRKIKSEALAVNIPSVRYHGKLGFREEGYLCEEISRNNHYEDVILFAHFKDRWAEVKSQIKMAINRY